MLRMTLLACKKDKLLQTIEGLKEIPHNIVSPAFIGNHVKNFPAEIRPAIYQSIAFHHARGCELLNDKSWSFVEEAIRKDIVNRLDDLQDMQPLFNFELKVSSFSYLRKLRETLPEDVATFYLMLKGCLHRADHSGSAHLDIEEKPYGYSTSRINDYLLTKGIAPTRIWQFSLATSVSNGNVVLQAGTGSGKTEFALYWIKQQKAFYTLPIRTSVNAMYERLKTTYDSNNIGLLHGDSALYALSNDPGDIEDDGIKETLRRIDISRQLSMPISVTTADQLFTTAFRYLGYEKIFATLAYSRLVIDEIQSYDPDMVAVILKTLVDLSKIGCKFCIITATLPKIILVIC
jgi:CRISPR-associated endonuclease/helicase Cas3